MFGLIEGVITLIISIWVIMSVLGIKPFHNQQGSFLKVFSKKLWLVCSSIAFVYSLSKIINALV